MRTLNEPTLAELEQFLPSIREIVRELDVESGAPNMMDLLRRYPKAHGESFNKPYLSRAYRQLCAQGAFEYSHRVAKRFQVKKVRTISGVAPVTVLTKPFPCPGECVFCPTDHRMPKSYLPDEPGAMRALRHEFDPYEQVSNRIRSFHMNGHNTDKIELLILGGTWSSYKKSYQRWFLQRCFDAMNGVDSESLEHAHRINESAQHRNVGIVIETRPDHVNPAEVRRLRQLGVTKVQMGAQTFDEDVLELNKRGHTAEETRMAVALLRSAGFKVVLHWMPNLLGATLESDREDIDHFFGDDGAHPDELKFYPCSLLKNADLYQYWQRGEWEPYSDEEIIELAIESKSRVPKYCRINRVFREIPKPNIVVGCTQGNLRQVVQAEMKERGLQCDCIRCREIGWGTDISGPMELHCLDYETRFSREKYLSFDTSEGRLAGYLRLSLPVPSSTGRELSAAIPELEGAALVREVHVYGPALALGDSSQGNAVQHMGLGRRLLAEAERIALDSGYRRLAIIASVGTRGYYGRRGYELDGTYMVRDLREVLEEIA